jgi:hypothetical protein
VLIAEEARDAGASVQGDLLDVLRLAVYWAWGWAVWKASRNVQHPLWAALLLGVVAAAVLY